MSIAPRYNSNSNYHAFIRRKQRSVADVGFVVSDSDIHPTLFEWQRRIVQWAVQRGSAALFEECGLGKTLQQLEWARLVHEHTGKRVLILTPLAVAHQTVGEADKINVRALYCRAQSFADVVAVPAVVTNYDMLKSFDPLQYAGVVLDESSILKSFTGATRDALIAAFASTPYRLACTATPAPNDYTELGNHAEFLGVMKRTEMLAEYFKHDGGDTSVWRLKRHAEHDFWRWVTSWAVCISRPSDLGCSDDGFALPPLHLHEHIVRTDHSRAHSQGQLFVDGTVSATTMWQERRHTLAARVDAAIAQIESESSEAWVVWCDTNDEADALQARLPNAVEVRGSDSPSEKERKLRMFSDGDVSTIITKPDIAGFGLNWQHSARSAFVGVAYSFERFYQAIKRQHRFRQSRDVHAHLFYAESEGSIRQALQVKQRQHIEMQERMNEAMRETGIVARRQQHHRQHQTAHISLPPWVNQREDVRVAA